MISQGLNFIVAQLNRYMQSVIRSANAGPNEVVLGNIAMMEDQETSALIKNHVVVTVVNMIEEAALKNGRRPVELVNGERVTLNLPISLNLFLLFSANYTGSNAYDLSLTRLSHVISFFQSNRRFEFQNIDGDQVTDFRILIETHTLTFEQLNYLWGTLGGRQVPSILYRARLVQLSAEIPQVSVPEISRIRITQERSPS